MAIWDDEKNRTNIRDHGVSFEEFDGFQWQFAACFDIQYHEGEEREVWAGPIGDRIRVAVITMRGETVRLISLRRATQPEIDRWRKEF